MIIYMYIQKKIDNKNIQILVYAFFFFGLH